ncbi:MAG: YbaY family lipoprotein [Candidatus Brevundimonas colombiensis]|uniref:YbaY family lipoprotein n=1 Tax=Candidatus Brevundimonas colombiensis TaxID=3121376 RepID=A0AAJ6BKF0_9CAUL|nr:YbaY family lipoprotein [Brevundimonas sp.]WEK39187.1 MAG: YbaY family lipoprotein [Brevundimonas sp.]
MLDLQQEIAMRNAAFVLPAALVLAACATPGEAPPPVATGTTVVTVTALYRERIMLPPGHVLTVRVEDVSLADAPAKVLAETRETLTGGPPYSVTLGFPTSQIDPRHTYAVRAEIRDPSGALVFTTDTRHSILTHGAPTSAEIVLKSVR